MRVAEVQANNNDNMKIGIFKNGVKQFATGGIYTANDTKTLVVAWYFEDLVAGDDISIRITNTTDNDDPVVISAHFYLRKEHT